MRRVGAILLGGLAVLAACGSNGPPPVVVGFTVTASPTTAVAGAPAALTVTAVDSAGARVRTYRGAVHISSDDAQAVAPADLVFGLSDQGSKQAPFTARTAGIVLVSARDTSSSGVDGSLRLGVTPAAAASCAVIGAPASERAGKPVAVLVEFVDAFQNLAIQYLATVHFTSSDPRATLPPDTAFGGADSGERQFGFRFGTVGAQTVTASDGTIACSASTTIAAGPAAQLALSGLPQATVAGAPSVVVVTAQDPYGNLAADYAGTPAPASTDPNATFGPVTPVSAGVNEFPVTFGTIGAHTVTAADVAGFAGTSGAVDVRGLVYTAPSTATAAVALLPDVAASNAGNLVLNLVALAPFTGYSAGFNIPADSARVSVARISKGNSLDPGSAPAAIAAALRGSGPLANVLTSGLSQKAAGAGSVAGDTAVVPGQVLYTLVLRPTAPVPGVVFDGGLPGARAAVRDSEGNEVLSQADFAIGRLEVQ
ncbi:MAG: hypothetical protein ACJ79H_00825 [Myxococcales bacterium]